MKKYFLFGIFFCFYLSNLYSQAYRFERGTNKNYLLIYNGKVLVDSVLNSTKPEGGWYWNVNDEFIMPLQKGKYFYTIVFEYVSFPGLLSASYENPYRFFYYKLDKYKVKKQKIISCERKNILIHFILPYDSLNKWYSSSDNDNICKKLYLSQSYLLINKSILLDTLSFRLYPYGKDSVLKYDFKIGNYFEKYDSIGDVIYKELINYMPMNCFKLDVEHSKRRIGLKNGEPKCCKLGYTWPPKCKTFKCHWKSMTGRIFSW